MSTEIKLIQEIKKHECLYNYTLPDYNRKDLLDEKWSEIAKNLDLSVSECKEKWKNIRSSFVRSLKQSKKKDKRPYYLSNYLGFIVPYLKYVSKSDANNSQSQSFQIELESIDNSYEGSNSPMTYIKEEAPVSDDEHDGDIITGDPLTEESITTKNAMRYFLLSLLPEFDKMSEEQRRIFKIKTLMLIDDIKSDHTQVKKSLKSVTSNERLQKRLINLLLKNLERKRAVHRAKKIL